MTLREPNNPTTDLKILAVLKALLPIDPVTGEPNTQIGLNQAGLGKDLIYIEDKYSMSLGAFPAIHLSSGNQTYNKNSRSTYLGTYIAVIEYYDRWDKQPNSIDTIRKNIATDLERLKANIEENESLAYEGQAHAISISNLQLSPYAGSIESQSPSLILIKRSLTLSINILPYDA